MRLFFQERSLVFLLACVLAVAGTAHASVLEFHVDISGTCAATGSPGTGTGTFTLDTNTGLLEWEIVISGLTSPEIGAHIHGPITPGCGAMGNGKKRGHSTFSASMAGVLSGGGRIRGPIAPRSASASWGCPTVCCD